MVNELKVWRQVLELSFPQIFLEIVYLEHRWYSQYLYLFRDRSSISTVFQFTTIQKIVFSKVNLFIIIKKNHKKNVLLIYSNLVFLCIK